MAEKLSVTVTHEQPEQRYLAFADDLEVGHLDYVESDGVVTFTHTIVPDEFGGRGVAGALVKDALDDVRERDLTVVPRCSYVRSWIQRHPEYLDLVHGASAPVAD